jgi:polysaccharide export outer membrane protein
MFSTLFALDVVQVQTESRTDIRGGVEIPLGPVLKLRAGGNRDEAAAGLGLAFGHLWNGSWGLDYGYAYPFDLDKNDRLHAISLRVSFGPGEPQPALSGEKNRPARKEETEMAQKPAKKPKAPLLLGPQDVVSILVKDHPEFDVVETKIDNLGNIELPFVGEVEAANLSVADFENKLSKIFKEYVREPKVKVEVLEYNSRIVFILGAVKLPGRYPMKDEVLTLRDAMVLAGLPTDRAAMWRVRLIRQGKDGPYSQYVNLHKILKRGHLENDVTLLSEDIIYVPMTVLDSFVTLLGRIFGPLLGMTRDVAGAAIN